MTSSGDACSGSLTIGLSGSVTTNAYLLYTNGVDSGLSVAGTGSAINFGSQTTAGIYSIIASNTVTGSEGPMYGSATISAPGVFITSQPASVAVVTNVAASFSVAASGTALSYQWYENGVALTNGGGISGVTTSNLSLSLSQADDIGSYYVVVQNPCGDAATSSPPVTLTLIPPQQLVWQGAVDNIWDYTDLNFTNSSGSPQAFIDGDDVIFDDTSANTAVSLTNSLVPTLVTVNASQSYTFSDGSGVGNGKLTGFGQLVDAGTGTLTIDNNDDYTGGTTVGNGATLSIGDGTAGSVTASLAGVVTVNAGGTLLYNYGGSGTATMSLNHTWAGGGAINCSAVNGATIATPLSGTSSNFNGTINIQGYAALHAVNGNEGYALGNGSTINVPDYTQVWLDSSASVYNNTFNIGGTGWQGASPSTGALRVYDCIVTGPVNLTDNARIGGTIDGATITGPISDNGNGDQLEIYGVGYGLGSGSSEFILSVSNSAN
ncbi:MAG: hypothetical protein WBQ21_05710, partial [Solirubrobacteraceae bacterium]